VVNAVALYLAQMAAQRGIRDRLVAGLGAAELARAPAPGLPSMLWHLGHAAFTNAAAFLGQGLGDWSLVDAAAVARFNIGAHADAPLPSAEVVLAQIARWDAAGDVAVARLEPADLALPLRGWRADFLPEECRTWGGCLAYLAPHEAYHAGAVGVLRRLAGHPGLQ
jgi:hypothetical protein